MFRQNRATLLRRRAGAPAAAAPEHVWTPADIPEIAAGFWWDPSAATGAGTAAFKLPEAQGKTSHDLVAPTALTAPLLETINDQTVLVCVNGNPPAIDRLARTVGAVTRGSTGALYVAGWMHSPGGNGIVIAIGRQTDWLFAAALGSTDCRIFAFDAGIQRECRFPLPVGGWAASPHFLEFAFVPTAAANNRFQFFAGLSQRTPTVAATYPDSMPDVARIVNIAGSFNDGSGYNITADFRVGAFAIANGLPSLEDRQRFMQWAPLK